MTFKSKFGLNDLVIVKPNIIGEIRAVKFYNGRTFYNVSIKKNKDSSPLINLSVNALEKNITLIEAAH